jgi:hypothetical protein
MAILKHIASKNSNYCDALNYLIYKHDEYTQEPILDENGQQVLRDEYYLDGILCHPLEFARVCKKTNEKFHKNQKHKEIKSHHYILSFDPRDAEDNGLTGEEAQRMGLQFAEKNFPGHQALVCTHTDGHNGSGNIHVHIVINSVRAIDVERQDFMERLCDCKAGNKHHLTNAYESYLKQQLMTMCKNRQLYQIDLLNPALDKITEEEYWAKHRGQEKLDKRNEEIRNNGLIPRTTKFETQKDFLRKAISSTASKSKDLEEFQRLLLEEYGISLRDKRGRFSYTHPDRKKAITGQTLGAAYEREYLLQIIMENQKDTSIEQVVETDERTMQQEAILAKFATSKVQLIIDLKTCIKAQQSRAYAQRIKIINLQQMAQTLTFVQEHGYNSVEELEEELTIAMKKSSSSLNMLKSTEARLSEVNKQIHLTGQYLGNKAVYTEYRKMKKSKKFYEEHRAEISLYESARDSLREISGGQKLPSMKMLKQEKEDLLVVKNSQYEIYQANRTEQQKIQTICSNVRQMLNLENEQEVSRKKTVELS